jgi:uncharacterized protein YcaQ
MSPPPAKISLSQARRIALAAQGLGEPRSSGEATRLRMGRAIERSGLLQIDSVNVLTRMHYLPLFSRLGAYSRPLLEEAAWGAKRNRTLFEYWAHEASLLPLRTQPLLRWRMARAEQGLGTWGKMKPFAGERRGEAETLLKRIDRDGASTASDLCEAKGSGGWWGWSETKSALEWLFWSGQITTKTRRSNFERVYDLTERVLPSAILDMPTPSEADAHRGLLAAASKALGVATVLDLRDYFRLSPEDAKPRILELVETGELIPLDVEGWRGPAYVHRDARNPRSASAKTLLAPFDPLIWERSRTERLFGFRYRIEIYTPADKREYGYYVLPFLMGDALVARVDLKFDRANKVLVVQAAHREPEAPDDVMEHLAVELRLMAGWLGADDVTVQSAANAAEHLNAALRAA